TIMSGRRSGRVARMKRELASVGVLLVVLGQMACASAGPPSSAAPSASAPVVTAPDEGANKTLVVAQANQFATLGPFGSNNTSGGGATLMGIHTNGLMSLDDQGNAVGRIAVGAPSLADGSLAVLPDGRMQTTWHLRPDVTWHDGAPFTAADIAFTQRVRARITPGNPEDAGPYIESV